jgi:hypothetical protein
VAGKSTLRCDDFIEQREHGRVAPHVVNSNQCGSAVLWTQGFERKVMRSIQVMREFVSRSDNCA